MDREPIETEASADGAFQAEIPPGRTIRSALERAVKSGLGEGIVIAFFLNLFIYFFYKGVRGSSGSFAELQTQYALPASLVVAAAVTATMALYKFWRQLPLTRGTVLSIVDGGIEVHQSRLTGQKTLFSGPIRRVDYVQKTPIQKSSIAGEVPTEQNWEVTLVTDDGLHVISRGLGEGQSERLKEKLDRALDSKLDTGGRAD